MAGPGGKEVGRVSIRVLPDTSKFGVALKAYLERMERRLVLRLPVGLDPKSVAKTLGELEAITRDREIDIELDTKDLVRNVSRVSGGLARWAPLILAAVVAVGALVAALPAAIAILGGPIAAIALGFDGIKRAAAQLSDEFVHLRQSVSDVFERGMGPSFERLGKMFGVFEQGFDRLAAAISGLFDAFTESLSFQTAIGRIGSIFENIAGFLDGMKPAVEPFVNSVALLAEVGAKAARAITPEFVALFQRFSEQMALLATNGELQAGMEGIGHLLLGIGGALAFVVEIGIRFAAMFERIGEGFAKFLGWASKVPGQVIGFFAGLPGRLYALGIDALQGLWDGMKAKYEELKSWLAQKAAEVVGIFSGLWSIQSPSKVFRELGQFAGEGLNLGFRDSMDKVVGSARLLAVTTVTAAKASSFGVDGSSAQDFSRPIYADGIGLIGFIKELANGEAQLVWAEQDAFSATIGRMR